MTEDLTIDVDNIKQLKVEDGDALVVTMPELTNTMPVNVRETYVKNIQQSFEDIFADKKIRVIIVPHDMKVEMLLTSDLEDK